MIVGITGTDGAGKGAVVEYLVKQKGFTHYSGREFITAEIEARNLPVSRPNMRLVANAMRKEKGKDVIVTSALERQASEGKTDIIIESIRAMKEVETLHKNGGVLLAIDANQQLRYQRISGRKSASDRVTFDEFIAQEALEMNDPDPNGMQKADVISAADFTIMNDGSMSELHRNVDVFLERHYG